MRHPLLYALMGLLLLVFSACFTITEDITLNANGSGKVKTTFDMTEMMGMLALFIPDSLKEQLAMGDSAMQQATARYQAVPGISNVKSHFDSKGLVEIAYDFANAEALNKAMDLSQASENQLSAAMTNNYTMRKRSVARQTSFKTAGTPPGLLGELNLEEDNEMLSMVNAPTYRIVYHLPNNAKRVKSEKGATVTKDGKNVTLEYNFFDMLKNKEKNVFDHQISY